MIALIDGDFLLYFCTYQKAGSPQLTPESVINSADTFLREILNTVETNEYIGFLTSPKNFRKVDNPDYKANRKKVELPEYFHILKEHLIENWDFKVRELYEADDLIGIHYRKDSHIIISPDKDLLMLEGMHYNPIKKCFISTEPGTAFIFFWSSMIIGDKSDNVKGIEGRGPAYTTRLLEEHLGTPVEALIFNEYIQHYGEYEGIQNFYKNYNLLKILTKPLVTDLDFELFKPNTYNGIKRIHDTISEDSQFSGE